MRSLLYSIAALLIAGGALAIAFPRAVAIPHAAGRYMRGSTEYMSADRAVFSGFVALGFGAFVLWAALSWKGWDAEAEEAERHHSEPPPSPLPNQSTDPTLSSGTSREGHEPRHR
jgi:hypothetical protein